jgi:Mrp family chromosome partitioning ATPase
MGTTHDALERAELRSQRDRRTTSLEPGQEEAKPELDAAAAARFVADHGAIKNNVLALGADGLTKRLLLINTLEEGESADCALRFAASLTEDSDLEVLVVDLNPWTLSLREVFRIDHTHGLLDLFSEAGEKAPTIEKAGPGDLYTARLGGDHARLPELLESGGFDRFLDSINERFDFVILDMPGGAGFQECRALCAKVDAAALVLQSGASADQIARGAKKYIENPADKLLGVIVDKAKANRRKRVKVVSTVVATCLVFGLGFLVGDLGMEPGDAAPDRLKSAAGAEAGIDPPSRERAIPLARPAQPVRVEAARALAQEAPAAAAAKPADSAGLRPGEETRVEEALAKEDPVVEAGVTEARVKEAGLGEGQVEEAPATEAQATAGQAEEGRVRTVVVSRGDNLFRIILGAYGTYNEGLLRRVLDENPEIPSSKKILVGRTIRLPRVD